jgi:hypothetical protein
MTACAFTNWQKNGHEFINTYIFKTEGEKNRWGRLLCTWNELGNGSPQKRVHHVCYCIDLYTGEVYLDDSKRLIFMKMLGSIAVRVAQIFQKTMFHLLLPISLPIIVTATVKQEIEQHPTRTRPQIAQKCLKNCAKSIQDIIRTPLFGMAMIVSTVFALVITPFGPSQLYDLRKSIAELEDKLCENDMLGWWKFTPCFHPFNSIDQIHQQNRKKHADTDYAACQNQFEINLTNMARSSVLFHRNSENRDVFHCFSTHPYNSGDYPLELNKENMKNH